MRRCLPRPDAPMRWGVRPAIERGAFERGDFERNDLERGDFERGDFERERFRAGAVGENGRR